MTKLIIADDHQIVIDGLKLLLAQETDIELLGEANNGRQALNILEKDLADIAVLDVEMPVLDGIDTAKKIQEQFPSTKILMLTMYNDQAFIRKLIEIGVSGYILKNKGREEFIEAIRDISNGKTFFGREVTNLLISGIQTASKKEQAHSEVHLTKREKEVLMLIADGLSTPQISERLFIAHSTVEVHRRNVLDKTGVPNSKALIKWAIVNGYSD